MITRTAQRARRSTVAWSSGPSEVRNPAARAVITSDCPANSPPMGSRVEPNHDDMAGLSRTIRSVAMTLAISRSRGSSMPPVCFISSRLSR
jgi:hypothetical protein